LRIAIDQRRRNLDGLGKVDVGQRTRIVRKRRGDTKHERGDVRKKIKVTEQ
jgi:hypothetical protein